jgi:hypothetical protein
MPTRDPPIPALLGLKAVAFERPPLISTETTLWGLYCVPPEASTPVVVSWWKSEARAQQHLAWVLASTWRCHRCRQPYARHTTVEGGGFTEVRARQLAAVGHADPTPPVDPEELAHRAPVEGPLTFSDTPADPEAYLPAPPQKRPAKRATKASPQRPTQDPFEEEPT